MVSNPISGWQEFTEFAAQFRFGDPFRFSTLLRGQADASHSLKPSLNRLFPADITEPDALGIEASLLHEFKLHAWHLIPSALHPAEDAPIEWWALMQHHGVPTRLLDWSASPYVAAYFAVADAWDKDGAIWIVHPHTLLSDFPNHGLTLEEPLDPIAIKAGGPHAVTAALASKRSDRMIAQQGQFTYSLNILCDHELAISAIDVVRDDLRGKFFGKLVIPHALKSEFLDQLRAMNVSANSLFPGVDGLGRSLHELAQIACLRLGRRSSIPQVTARR